MLQFTHVHGLVLRHKLSYDRDQLHLKSRLSAQTFSMRQHKLKLPSVAVSCRQFYHIARATYAGPKAAVLNPTHTEHDVARRRATDPWRKIRTLFIHMWHAHCHDPTRRSLMPSAHRRRHILRCANRYAPGLHRTGSKPARRVSCATTPSVCMGSKPGETSMFHRKTGRYTLCTSIALRCASRKILSRYKMTGFKLTLCISRIDKQLSKFYAKIMFLDAECVVA